MVSHPEINGIYVWYYKGNRTIEHFVFIVKNISTLVWCDIIYLFNDHNNRLETHCNSMYNVFCNHATKLSDVDIPELKRIKAKYL